MLMHRKDNTLEHLDSKEKQGKPCRRLLIDVDNPLVIRNFIETDSFQRVEEEFDVIYFLEKSLHQQFEKYFQNKAIAIHNFDQAIPSKIDPLKKIFFKRASRFSATYAFYARPRKRKKMYQRMVNLLRTVFAIPIMYDMLAYLLDYITPEDEALVRTLDQLHPDCVLMLGSRFVNLARASKRLGIPCGNIPGGWDHISSKLFIHPFPDFIIERGYENALAAKKIFELDSRRIEVVGVPHYEMYFSYQKKMDAGTKREAYLHDKDIPLNRKVFLFGGSLRPFDEIGFLRMLDEAISDGRIEKLAIIYRPHPWRDRRLSKDSFFDDLFQHVFFDEEMKASYWNPKTPFLPDLSNYMDMYNAIDGIISPFSSVMVEAGLFGKPVLGLGCDDGYHYGVYGPQVMASREHFRLLKKFDWFVECRQKERFLDDCIRLLALSKQKGLPDRIKRDLKLIVYSDPVPFEQRILDAVKRQLPKT